MENLFLKTLNAAKQDKKLVAVYTDKEKIDSFSVGYIVEQIEEGLLLQAKDPNGFEDGLIFLNIDDIYLIETDTKYLRNLTIVISGYAKLKERKPFVFKRSKNESLIIDFLNKCLTDKILVSIKLFFGKGITGFINEVDQETLVVSAITDEGENDGNVYFKIEEIERVYINGIDQKRIEILLNTSK